MEIFVKIQRLTVSKKVSLRDERKQLNFIQNQQKWNVIFHDKPFYNAEQ